MRSQFMFNIFAQLKFADVVDFLKLMFVQYCK